MRLGNENLFTEPYHSLLQNARVGMVTNYTGINTSFERTIDRLIEKGVNVKKLFAPEHGFYGVGKAGESMTDEVDRKTGIEIVSLYGQTTYMNPSLLEGIDVLILEIQDVGVRFYTYISTMFRVMEAAGQAGIPLVILDRPNPLGGTVVEGSGVESRYRSFVGAYDLPIRHGMTIGELAVLYKHERDLNVIIHIVKLEGWNRDCLFLDTDLNWVPPSPNIPDFKTSLLYPGTAFIEGTNMSEGRGTTMPFSWIGAPWINGEKWADVLNELDLPGVMFRPIMFKPALSKYQGEVIEGVEVHITDHKRFIPTTTGLHIINQTWALYPDHFEWIESESNLFIDLLWGSAKYRHDLTRGRPVSEISAEWGAYAAEFIERRKPYLLYP
ncbi:exo-beta-N-acetylmuramidase NamZ family protein [Lentibacillus salinarum]|uniref:Exo-beta-N-acetylmuramidase NamZ domain-containing protein n=1 Tax=Lentibacillus salinarum TaxID=446820 RepID=A0ABW3ZUQ5_9BACI